MVQITNPQFTGTCVQSQTFQRSLKSEINSVECLEHVVKDDTSIIDKFRNLVGSCFSEN